MAIRVKRFTPFMGQITSVSIMIVLFQGLFPSHIILPATTLIPFNSYGILSVYFC